MTGTLEGTRQRILTILQQRGTATVEDLAEELGLAPPTVRRHLDILLRDNYVAYRQVRRSVGRPYYSYYLTEEGKESLPKEYDKLLAMMLKKLASYTREEISSLSGEELLHKLFVDMARATAGNFSVLLPSNASVRERLDMLMEVLRRHQFSPTLKVLNGEAKIRLGNCPFRAAALAHHVVCEFDRTLISELLGVEARDEECVLNGTTFCCYVVPLSEKGPSAN